MSKCIAELKGQRLTWKAALFGYAPSLALPTQMAMDPTPLNNASDRLSLFHCVINEERRVWKLVLSMTMSSDMVETSLPRRFDCVLAGGREEEAEGCLLEVSEIL